MVKDTPRIRGMARCMMMPCYSELPVCVHLDGGGATSPEPAGVGSVTLKSAAHVSWINLVSITGVAGYENDSLVAIQASDPEQSKVFLRGAKDESVNCQYYGGEPYPFPWSADRWELFQMRPNVVTGFSLFSLAFDGYALGFKGGDTTQLSMLNLKNKAPELHPVMYGFNFNGEVPAP